MASAGCPGRSCSARTGRGWRSSGAAPTRQPVRLLEAATLEPLPEQPLGLRGWRWQATDLAFSQDGRRLAAVLHRVRGNGSTTRRTVVWAAVWDLENPRGDRDHEAQAR